MAVSMLEVGGRALEVGDRAVASSARQAQTGRRSLLPATLTTRRLDRGGVNRRDATLAAVALVSLVNFFACRRPVINQPVNLYAPITAAFLTAFRGQ
jgi:hypothetical protein